MFASMFASILPRFCLQTKQPSDLHPERNDEEFLLRHCFDRVSVFCSIFSVNFYNFTVLNEKHNATRAQVVVETLVEESEGTSFAGTKRFGTVPGLEVFGKCGLSSKQNFKLET